jgi:RNA polymerase sigma-70 factor (ECF subfamily)
MVGECTGTVDGRHAGAAPAVRESDIDRIYRAHVRSLYAYVYSRVGHREAAEDITADVFMRALMHLDTAREEHSIVAWLFRVARHAAADHWHRGQNLQGAPLEEARVAAPPARQADTARQAQTAAQAHELLAQLPANYRSVLECRLLEGLSVGETARRLGLSTANVKVLQFRALKRAAQLRIPDDPDGGASGRTRQEGLDTAALALGRTCPCAA